MVCKNWKCKHYWKYGKGTVFAIEAGKVVVKRYKETLKKERWFDEEIDIVMIEKNGGTFIKTNIKAFLTLIRDLVNPGGFTAEAECFNCNRDELVKTFYLQYGFCGDARLDDDRETYHWDYCKKCALNHAVYLLKYVLGEKLG